MTSFPRCRNDRDVHEAATRHAASTVVGVGRRGGRGAMALALALDLLAAAPDAAAVGAREPVTVITSERWLRPRGPERVELDRWRDAVGPAQTWDPNARPAAGTAIDAFHVVVWNTHVGAGAIERLVADLRRGVLTHGVPVEHFALLLQEVHRGGDSVPAALPPGSRSAGSIRPAVSRDGRLGIDEVARRTKLHLYYVPSMRNGRNAANPEDRGNAILATLPLLGLTAVELPFERERRVAISADIDGTTTAGTYWRIRLVNLHLDARSSWRNLHRSLGAGRARQMRWLLEVLRDDEAPAVLGGDFNSWVGGVDESPVRMLRARGFVAGRLRRESAGILPPHLLTLDHVFYRLPSGAAADTRELQDAYGSDHRPLLGWVRLDADCK
jgi:endonuclease/exonuclease/phosphatase family metal-dependent hydrolase